MRTTPRDLLTYRQRQGYVYRPTKLDWQLMHEELTLIKEELKLPSDWDVTEAACDVMQRGETFVTDEGGRL